MKTLLATVLILALTVTGYAKNFAFVGCSIDHKTMTLNVDVVDGTSNTVVKEIESAFTRAASQLTSGELQTDNGFYLFSSYLTDEDVAAISQIYSAPVIGPACK